jgi:hypothetical protein
LFIPEGPTASKTVEHGLVEFLMAENCSGVRNFFVQDTFQKLRWNLRGAAF